MTSQVPPIHPGGNGDVVGRIEELDVACQYGVGIDMRPASTCFRIALDQLDRGKQHGGVTDEVPAHLQPHLGQRHCCCLEFFLHRTGNGCGIVFDCVRVTFQCSAFGVASRAVEDDEPGIGAACEGCLELPGGC